MNVIETAIPGVPIVEPDRFGGPRCDSPKMFARDSAGCSFAQLAGRLPRYGTA
jgi:hypothetical protein